jgi:hypothetical protein
MVQERKKKFSNRKNIVLYKYACSVTYIHLLLTRQNTYSTYTVYNQNPKGKIERTHGTKRKDLLIQNPITFSHKSGEGGEKKL